MLILSRKLNEGISIGTDVRVVIVAIDKITNIVKLGIEAPPAIAILRDEAKERTPKQRASQTAPSWKPGHE